MYNIMLKFFLRCFLPPHLSLSSNALIDKATFRVCSPGSALSGFSLLSGSGEERAQVYPVSEDGSRERSECSSRCF